MKVYVSKYALSRGLFDVEVEESSVSGYVRSSDFNFFGKLGHDCFLDRDDAIRDARKRAMRECDRLRERLVKIGKLVDEPKWDGTVKCVETNP